MLKYLNRLLLAGWFIGMVFVAVRGTPAWGQGNDGGPLKQYFPTLMRVAPAQVNPPFRDYLAVGMSDGDGDAEIYTIRGDGSDLQQLTSNEWIDTEPRFSPDGSKIAFIQRDALRDATARPMVMNRDGTNPHPLLRGITANEARLQWSPDGQHLLVSMWWENPTGEATNLYLVALDGTITEIHIDSTERYGLFFGWSPDGRYIYYRIYHDSGTWSLWVVPMMGGTAQQLISSNLYSFVWHPDSRELLVLVVEEDDRLRGRLLAPDGSTNRLVFEGDYRFIEWVQADNMLLLQSLQDNKLFTVPRNGGALIPLTENGVRLGGVDATGTALLYMSDTITEATVYWETFDDEPRELLTLETDGSLDPGVPSLAQDGSGVVFPLYDHSDQVPYTYLYYANLDQADAPIKMEIYSYQPIRFLPFSSQRAVAQMGTGGYPPPRYAMPNMVDIQNQTIERLPFPDDLFLVYEWRYLP